MRFLLSHYSYPSQMRRTFMRLKLFSYQQVNHIFSKTGKWDEEHCSAAVLKEIESHWSGVFAAKSQESKQSSLSPPATTKGKKYVLAMFPYPSGQLHMGHVRVYTLSDALARFYRSQGYQVIHPIGWDAFGLPAENAAIERGMSPAVWTDQNIRSMKEQFQQLGCSFDWWRELRTCDPEYYRWTQEFFLRLYRAGLIYKKQAAVNWDPVDQTVLANEQVDQKGRAWRSGAKVEKKLLNQWYIRTTRFSQALYDGLDAPELQGWQNIIKSQKGWIGECTGYLVNMTLDTTGKDRAEELLTGSAKDRYNSINRTGARSSVSVFMRHPELLHGVSFLGVRSDHGLGIKGFREQSSGEISNEVSMPANGKNKCNYKVLNATVKNPITDRSIPLIMSDDLPFSKDGEEFYVGFGSGSDLDRTICQTSGFEYSNVLDGCSLAQYNAAMEAQRTHVLGRKNIENQSNSSQSCSNNSKDVSAGKDDLEPSLDYSTVIDRAKLANSGPMTGLPPHEALKHVLVALQLSQKGGYRASPGQQDWLISRQRHWGTPIPMLECPSCGPVPVPTEQLPVLLCPNTSDHQQWSQCPCPQCGGLATRETDTMDTFVDSSWYFLRFLDPVNSNAPFSKQSADQGMPVDVYVGGVEHAVLHLYFARFFQHFLKSEHFTQHSEPFNRLLLVGRIKASTFQRASDGRYLRRDQVDTSVTPPVDAETREPVKVLMEKMSKSKHNGVDPAVVIAEHSTDLTRLAVLRGEAPDSNRSWRDDSVQPASNWLHTIWRTVATFVAVRQKSATGAAPQEAAPTEASVSLREARNKTVAEVTRLYQEFQLHTVVMRLETFTRQIRSSPKSSLVTDEYERALAALLLMLAPVTPHACAELWQVLVAHGTVHRGVEGTVQDQPWPEPDPGYELPMHFTIHVNEECVHSEGLTGADVDAIKDEQTAISRAIEQTPAVRDAIAGQPVIRSGVSYSPGGLAVTVDFYTMDRRSIDKQRKKQRREASAARKAAKQQ